MDELYEEVVSFQHKCKDYIGEPSHHLGQSVLQAAQRLEDDAQNQKNPRSIEDGVKQLMPLLEKAAEEGVISHSHADELVDSCEELRSSLQKLS
jgi:mevalonate kinase